MHYMFLIYSQERAAGPPPEEIESIKSRHWGVMQDARQRGVLVAVEGLKPTQTATTIRVKNGKHLTIDGPFAETKEQLAGYYILDCKDLDEAIEIAAKIPGARVGSIEVRPIWEM